MLFHKFSRNRGRLFGEVESAFKNYAPKKLVKPETWFFFPNLESPFFQVFQQPFNFSCCYFAPGLDRLAAARDVTVSVTLADEERTGHLGMKRRFQQRLRKNVKNVGLTMLRRKCGSCFFSHRKSDLLAIFFFDSCFFQRYVFSTFHHRYVCNTEKVWVQVFHSSGSFFLRLGGFTCPNAVGCCYWRTMSRWPSLWAFILHTFLDLLMQKMLIGSFDSDELDPNVCCYGNCRDNWAIFVVRFLADRVRATGLPHCNPAGSFSNPYPQHSSGFPFLAA